MKILVAVSGASGASLGIKLFESIPKTYEKYLILSESAKTVLENEENIFFNTDLSAPPASGSFQIDTTFIVPCSMNTLAKISAGIADNLITRSALVAIKEKRKLILAPREMPFSTIHLEHMTNLAKLSNIFIAPPVIGYYHNPKTLEEMENFLIGKWLDLAGIKHNLFKRWNGSNSENSESLSAHLQSGGVVSGENN
ncbi:UbiX family flavin prenyltransferase [Lebetimonas sp. JH292]|uniref:UbiX family flavin prenyltransferase n=1 Tax=Lebetimonas sp. JH292 TaxID=990068 RepID=UPI000465C678|nr:UbiX family flavin prenyltransferase [Lebetimonas sp. JH292]